jgi:hypothetical protein
MSAWPPPLACDGDCRDACELSAFPVSMRPYRCRHVTPAIRRARDIVFAETRANPQATSETSTP